MDNPTTLVCRPLLLTASDSVAAIRTAYGEARGPDATTEIDVLWTMRNRAVFALPFWGGPSLYDVCHQPGQFSCWSLARWNAANLQAMLDLRAGSPDFERILGLLNPIAAGTESDPTNGATYYYAPKGTPTPAWARDQYDKSGKLIMPAPTPCRIDPDHIFYSIYPSSAMIPKGTVP